MNRLIILGFIFCMVIMIEASDNPWMSIGTLRKQDKGSQFGKTNPKYLFSLIQNSAKRQEDEIGILPKKSSFLTRNSIPLKYFPSPENIDDQDWAWAQGNHE